MVTLIVLAFLVLALLAYLVGIYNGLVRVGASVKLAWSNIDVLLVQRHDELPKLVEVCRQYMEYERDTLERVTKARNAVTLQHDIAADLQLQAVQRGLKNEPAPVDRGGERKD